MRLGFLNNYFKWVYIIWLFIYVEIIKIVEDKMLVFRLYFFKVFICIFRTVFLFLFVF